MKTINVLGKTYRIFSEEETDEISKVLSVSAKDSYFINRIVTILSEVCKDEDCPIEDIKRCIEYIEEKSCSRLKENSINLGKIVNDYFL